jgi:hypothetical protein
MRDKGNIETLGSRHTPYARLLWVGKCVEGVCLSSVEFPFTICMGGLRNATEALVRMLCSLAGITTGPFLNTSQTDYLLISTTSFNFLFL